MKKFISFSFLIFIFSCENVKSPITFQGNKLGIFTVQNTQNQDFMDVGLILKRSEFDKKIGQNRYTYFILVDSKTNEQIPYQLDDLNGDKIWDEMAFLVNLSSSEIKTINILLSASNPTFTKRSYARLGYSETRNNKFISVNEHIRPQDHLPQSKPWLYQFEGPGWENDKVAFRNYFDDRNTKDIFGKTIPEMVIDTIGLPMESKEGNYHEQKFWGMDVLKVGASLGAGGIALAIDDSLFRLSKTESASYKLLSTGPVRSIIQLQNKGWKVRDLMYSITETITIWAGNYSYESQSIIEPKLPENGRLVAGMVTVKSNKEPKTITTDKYSTVYNYDNQSENHDSLGLGIICKEGNFGKFTKAEDYKTEIATTSMIELKNINHFHFVAAWEKSNNEFKSEIGFKTYLQKLSEKLSSDFIIK